MQHHIRFTVSPNGRFLIGVDVIATGSYEMHLGSAPVGGTLTAAMRDFNLPTSRAPGDWPEPTRYQVRF